MKNYVVTAFVLGLLMAGSAGAAILGYDPTTGDMPGAGWTATGTTNPINGFDITGEIASLNVSGGDKGNWHYANAGLTSAGYTVDMRVQIGVDSSPSAEPAVLFLYDSGELIFFRVGKDPSSGLGTTRVDQEGGGTRASATIAPTDDGFHTFRYVRVANSFTVYMDAIATPILTGSILNNNAVPGFDRVLFGGGDSLTSGTYLMDFLIWDNANAIQEAPIPEPATMLLLALGGGLCIRRKRS